MNRVFLIPPAQFRGWPGDASVSVDRGWLCIEPCASGGAVNGGHDHRYLLEVGPVDLLALAMRQTVLRVRAAFKGYWLTIRSAL